MEGYGIRQLDFVKIEDNPFIGRVICGDCDRPFGRKTWNSTDKKLKRRVWQCNKKYENKGEVACKNNHIDEEVLYKAFVSSFNALLENKEKFLKTWKVEDSDELRKYTDKEFIGIIEDGIEINEFDLELYLKMIEKMVIFQDWKIVVRFLDWTDVECIIE